MGLYHGTLSLTRYRILGGKRRSKLAELSKLLDPRKVGEIKLGSAAASSKEEEFGWCRPLLETTEDHASLDESHWDMSACQADDGFILRIRIERRKVSAQLLQVIYKQKLAGMTDKKGNLPPRDERQKLKEKVKRDLVQKALPALSFIDLYWREVAGELWVFTTSKGALGISEKLFRETFADPLNLTLVKVEPPLHGLSRQEWSSSDTESSQLSRLALTIPQVLTEQVQS